MVPVDPTNYSFSSNLKTVISIDLYMAAFHSFSRSFTI